MSRHTDPVCKLCRREGVKLYFKGSRCYTPKCALEKRDQAPGMHTRRGKLSEYGVRLREKQKLRRFYGASQRQFLRVFQIASRSTENTGEVLLSLMERRLDNVVYRLGWAASRRAARQVVAHGHIKVNGRRVDIPSYLLKVNDVVSVKNTPKSLALVKLSLQNNPPKPPDYLELTAGDNPSGKLLRLPTRDDVDPNISNIQEQLIIEFTSR